LNELSKQGFIIPAKCFEKSNLVGRPFVFPAPISLIMKNKFYLLFGVFLLSSFALTAQWQIMPETSGIYVSKCAFPTPEVGYVIGNYSFSGWHAILKTNDGGQTWTEIFTQGPLNEMLFDLHFVSEEIGYLSMRMNVGPTMVSRVWRTTNGGLMWNDISPINADPGFGNAAIFALPGGHVYQGSSLNLNASHNNGQDWTENTTEDNDSAFSMSAPSAQRAAAGMWDGTFLYGGSLYLTDNGGASWTKTAIDKAYSQIVAVLTPDDQTVIGLSKGAGWNDGFPSLYKTSDFGANWDTLHINMMANRSASDMLMVNDTLYVSASDYPDIVRSADGGLTFATEATFEQPVNCLCAAENTVYAFGNLGMVMKKQSTAPSVGEAAAVKPALFPNPTNGSFSWTSVDVIREIRLTDLNGKLVLQSFPMGNTGTADITSLPAGVYTVSFKGENGLSSRQKLVVE